MRILFCGVAAIALSGCSWLGLGTGTKHKTKSHSSYKQSQKACGSCVGGQSLSRWNVESGIGFDSIIGGDFITGTEVHAPTLSGQPNLTLRDINADDAYNNGKRVSLGGSYALNPNRKVTAQAYYGKATGNDLVLGQQDGTNLTGRLSDYKTYGLEAGLRQYVRPLKVPLLKSIRPYVEGRLGAGHVDDIALVDLNQTVNANPLTPNSLAMYEGGWVPTAAGLIGIETPVFDRFTLGVETGLRYTGSLKSDNSDKATGSFNANYAGLNDGGAQYSIPLTLRGRYRF